MAKVNTGKCCSRALLSEWKNDLWAENFVTGSKKMIFHFCARKKSGRFREKWSISKNIEAVGPVLVSIDSSAHALYNDTKTVSRAFTVAEL